MYIYIYILDKGIMFVTYIGNRGGPRLVGGSDDAERCLVALLREDHDAAQCALVRFAGFYRGFFAGPSGVAG